MALTSFATLTTLCKTQVQHAGMFVKGTAPDDNWYAMEVDPATGALPVTVVTPPVPVAGRTLVASPRTVYTSTPVTTAAWTQLVAALADDVNVVEVFDSSGETMELGVGGSGSEVRACLIFPGGNGPISLAFASGDRISIRAVSADALVGENDINFYT